MDTVYYYYYYLVSTLVCSGFCVYAAEAIRYAVSIFNHQHDTTAARVIVLGNQH